MCKIQYIFIFRETTHEIQKYKIHHMISVSQCANTLLQLLVLPPTFICVKVQKYHQQNVFEAPRVNKNMPKYVSCECVFCDSRSFILCWCQFDLINILFGGIIYNNSSYYVMHVKSLPSSSSQKKYTGI